MKIRSALTPKAYLGAMRKHMGSHTSFFSERFTGFFLGRLFYVTYHSGFEWDRKYSSPKNAAMGYVKKAEHGSEVCFLRFRGAMCPLVALPILIIALVYSLLQGDLGTEHDLLIKLGITLGVTIPIVLLETLFESFTDRSEEGRRTLLSFLTDPSDPYANYYAIP